MRLRRCLDGESTRTAFEFTYLSKDECDRRDVEASEAGHEGTRTDGGEAQPCGPHSTAQQVFSQPTEATVDALPSGRTERDGESS